MSYFAEQVTPGHPDKLADQISDGILDAILAQDPYARVAVESLVTGSHIILAGETATAAEVDVKQVVENVITSTGYTEKWWPHLHEVQLLNLIQPQSPDLNQNIGDGAGDQGTMYGYAVREEHYLPPEYMIATAAAHAIYALHRERPDEFGCDGKTTATLDDYGKLTGITVAIHHGIPLNQCRSEVEDYVRAALNVDCPIAVNTSGAFTVGGAVADTGLTGRKIIADTYGGRGRHGGGAFSGKDARKVDRTGAYYARHLAIRALEQLDAYEVEVQLGYSIGDLYPRALTIVADGEKVEWRPSEGLFTPRQVADKFGLHKPIHSESTCFGHFTDMTKSWNRL